MEQAQWGAALRYAARMFGTTPDAFWRLSVTEWRMLTGDDVKPLARDELEALSAQFPDRFEEHA